MEQELSPGPEWEGCPGLMLLRNLAPVYCNGVSNGWHVSKVQLLLSGTLAGQVMYAFVWSVGNSCSKPDVHLH